MHYYQYFEILKNAFAQKDGKDINIENSTFRFEHLDFESKVGKAILDGSELLNCKVHETYFTSDVNISLEEPIDGEVWDLHDNDIECNKKFQYHLIYPGKKNKYDDVILFFHGLNERSWDKYLPWATSLATATGKVVILFPIAFHMERSMDVWSQRRVMAKLAEMRLDLGNNSDTSYVNAGLSARLSVHPDRLFWSGLQTYSDITRVVLQIKAGTYTYISKNAKIDLFGYSIGSFLSLILLMANPRGIFSNSKLFCFCGGMTIDRMHPVSKYIMDSKAGIDMNANFARLLHTNFQCVNRLGHYQNEQLHPEESWFKTMLLYQFYQEKRENRFKELVHQIKCLVLEKDEVTPAIEALNTLKGGYRNIGINVEIQDYNYPYTHMVPFSLSKKYENEVDEAFDRFVTSMVEFYGKSENENF